MKFAFQSRTATYCPDVYEDSSRSSSPSDHDIDARHHHVSHAPTEALHERESLFSQIRGSSKGFASHANYSRPFRPAARLTSTLKAQIPYTALLVLWTAHLQHTYQTPDPIVLTPLLRSPDLTFLLSLSFHLSALPSDHLLDGSRVPVIASLAFSLTNGSLSSLTDLQRRRLREVLACWPTRWGVWGSNDVRGEEDMMLRAVREGIWTCEMSSLPRKGDAGEVISVVTKESHYLHDFDGTSAMGTAVASRTRTRSRSTHRNTQFDFSSTTLCDPAQFEEPPLDWRRIDSEIHDALSLACHLASSPRKSTGVRFSVHTPWTKGERRAQRDSFVHDDTSISDDDAECPDHNERDVFSQEPDDSSEALSATGRFSPPAVFGNHPVLSCSTGATGPSHAADGLGESNDGRTSRAGFRGPDSIADLNDGRSSIHTYELAPTDPQCFPVRNTQTAPTHAGTASQPSTPSRTPSRYHTPPPLSSSALYHARHSSNPGTPTKLTYHYPTTHSPSSPSPLRPATAPNPSTSHPFTPTLRFHTPPPFPLLHHTPPSPGPAPFPSIPTQPVLSIPSSRRKAIKTNTKIRVPKREPLLHLPRNTRIRASGLQRRARIRRILGFKSIPIRGTAANAQAEDATQTPSKQTRIKEMTIIGKVWRGIWMGWR